MSGYRIMNIVSGENNMHNNTQLSCHKDVNCPEGNGYENEKNAVAQISMLGWGCTGALLNTTANDNTPVFLTANNCFTG